MAHSKLQFFSYKFNEAENEMKMRTLKYLSFSKKNSLLIQKSTPFSISISKLPKLFFFSCLKNIISKVENFFQQIYRKTFFGKKNLFVDHIKVYA